MTKISLSSIAHFFRTGKWGKDTDTTGNEEIASLASGVQQKIGNQGDIERLTQNSGIKSAGDIPGEEKIEDRQPENAQPENAQTQNTQPENAGDRKNSIEALYKELKTSKRGGFHLRSGNSGFYKNVMKYLENIVSGMKEGFSSDIRSNLKKFDDMQAEYQHLIDACEDYTKRAPSTTQGKIRQNIVQNILNMAQKDLIGLNGVSVEFAALPPEEQAGKTWAELIDRARVTELYVDDLFGIKKENEGRSSEVRQLTPGMVKIRKKDRTGTEKELSGTYFFKQEEEIDLDQKTYSLQSVNSILDRYSELPIAEKEILRNWAAEQTIEEEKWKELSDLGLSDLGKTALKTIQSRIAGIREVYLGCLIRSGISSESGSISVTKRNVATSRMAALLGLEDLVAKSYTAELYDEATKKKIQGNMMEKAEGMDTTAFCRQRGENPEKKPPAISRLVQRDFVNLQVLDVLCGQMDRSGGNVMLRTEGDTITGIKGIDNDASFGLNIDIAGMRARRVYDPNTGEIVLPYMDKNLAERILALAPDAVRFSLKGLITDQEIEAAVQRLRMMQGAIRKTKEKDEDRFLEDSQWNQKTVQTLFERGFYVYNSGSDRDERLREILKKRFNKDKAADLDSEEKEEYDKIRKQLTIEMDNRILNTDNYFTYMMLSTIDPGLSNQGLANIPQIEVR